MPEISSAARTVIAIFTAMSVILTGVLTIALEDNLRYQVRRLSSSATETPAPGATPTPEASATQSQTPEPAAQTPPPNYTPQGFCEDGNTPCLLLPRPGEGRTQLALRSAFEDSCRWPEIMNQQRLPDGAYRGIDGLLTLAGVFIPDPETAGDYAPRIRTSSNRFEFVPACDSFPGDPPAYQFPCVYIIQPEDNITGYLYNLLVSKFYGGLGVSLAGENFDKMSLLVQNANLENGCSQGQSGAVRLFPGVPVVIPLPPALPVN